MNTIELKNTLPEVFATRDDITSDIWHQEVTFEKGKVYLVEAKSGTGKSSLCSYIIGYRDDYQGLICFDGKNVRQNTISDWVEIRKHSLSMLFQELRLFPEFARCLPYLWEYMPEARLILRSLACNSSIFLLLSVSKTRNC